MVAIDSQDGNSIVPCSNVNSSLAINRLSLRASLPVLWGFSAGGGKAAAHMLGADAQLTIPFALETVSAHGGWALQLLGN
jgi:hypothetical protein